MAFKKIITLFIAALATCTIQAQQVKLIPEPSSIQIGKLLNIPINALKQRAIKVL